LTVQKPTTTRDSSETTAAPTDSTLSFEASIAALGHIVEQLERGDLPLEESLGLFERGMQLSKEAQSKLDLAEKRVEMLLGFDENDAPITTALDPNASR
jgi:exodeoxyribonuclease VII small subunit